MLEAGIGIFTSQSEIEGTMLTSGLFARRAVAHCAASTRLCVASPRRFLSSDNWESKWVAATDSLKVREINSLPGPMVFCCAHEPRIRWLHGIDGTQYCSGERAVEATTHTRSTRAEPAVEKLANQKSEERS
jgi:hypothetical protein